MHVLTFDDPTIGQVILTGPVFTIGRAIDSSLQICHSGISRRHCQFTQTSEGWKVEDLGSANHTYVNNILITSPLLLKEGDTLRLDGSFTATFRFDPELTQPDRPEEDTAILEPRLEKRLDQIDLSFEALERQLREAEGKQLDVIAAVKAELDELRINQSKLSEAIESNRCGIDANSRAIAENNNGDLLTNQKLKEVVEDGRKSLSKVLFGMAIVTALVFSLSVVREAQREAIGNAIIEVLVSKSGPSSVAGMVVLIWAGQYVHPKDKLGQSKERDEGDRRG